MTNFRFKIFFFFFDFKSLFSPIKRSFCLNFRFPFDLFSFLVKVSNNIFSLQECKIEKEKNMINFS